MVQVRRSSLWVRNKLNLPDFTFFLLFFTMNLQRIEKIKKMRVNLANSVIY